MQLNSTDREKQVIVNNLLGTRKERKNKYEFCTSGLPTFN